MPLPPLLFRPPFQVDYESLSRRRVSDLRKLAAAWGIANTAKMQPGPCAQAIEQAMKDSAEAERVVHGLRPQERAVLEVYRRYGGRVSGSVIRLELRARALLSIETRVGSFYRSSRWKVNWIEKLSASWYLVGPQSPVGYGYYGSGEETERPFGLYSVHPALLPHLEPAGPCPWRLPPARGTPDRVTVRNSALVALDLARVFSAVSARRAVKTTASGRLVGPALQSLIKTVPMPGDQQFPLPDQQGLYFEILRGYGAIHGLASELTAEPETAAQLFSLSTAQQAHHWARAWSQTPCWVDALGIVDPEVTLGAGSETELYAQRQILCWTLSCLAQENAAWFDLYDFLSALQELVGKTIQYSYRYHGGVWNPQHPEAQGKEHKNGPERARAFWFDRQGVWYANAIMITLVALGLVERGTGSKGAAPYYFRLTPLGRAVFGAPEIAAPVQMAGRFLVVQPNFDVVAYLEQADAATAGFLGRMTEAGNASTESVQTFRITRNSVYQALENGTSATEVFEFLTRHNQGELPANVMQMLKEWSAKREGLTLYTSVTLLGFPSQAERDAYQEKQGGTPIGDRYLRARNAKAVLPQALVRDHEQRGRTTLLVDEQGNIHGRPLDLLQRARLQRIAEPRPLGWQVTATSAQHAAVQGIKWPLLRDWLAEGGGIVPPLLAMALRAWMGARLEVALADTLVLQVPNLELHQAIVDSERLKPFIVHTPGPGWLVIRKEDRAALTALLKELGFEVSKTLVPQDPTDKKEK